jgi:hypothetical protein
MGSNLCCAGGSSANDYLPLSRRATKTDSDVSPDLEEQEKCLRDRFFTHKKSVSFVEGEVPNKPLRRVESILRRRKT